MSFFSFTHPPPSRIVVTYRQMFKGEDSFNSFTSSRKANTSLHFFSSFFLFILLFCLPNCSSLSMLSSSFLLSVMSFVISQVHVFFMMLSALINEFYLLFLLYSIFCTGRWHFCRILLTFGSIVRYKLWAHKNPQSQGLSFQDGQFGQYHCSLCVFCRLYLMSLETIGLSFNLMEAKKSGKDCERETRSFFLSIPTLLVRLGYIRDSRTNLCMTPTHLS